MRQRYVTRGRTGKSRLINELCEQWGYERKHAIKLLGAKAGWGGHPDRHKDRPPKFGVEVVDILWRIWKLCEQAYGKRLKALLPTWLPYYELEYGDLRADLYQKMLGKR